MLVTRKEKKCSTCYCQFQFLFLLSKIETKTRNPCCDRNLRKKNLKFGTLYGFSALCYQSELIEENDIDLYKSIETNKLKSKHSIQNIVNAIYICIEYHGLGGFKV